MQLSTTHQMLIACLCLAATCALVIRSQHHDHAPATSVSSGWFEEATYVQYDRHGQRSYTIQTERVEHHPKTHLASKAKRHKPIKKGVWVHAHTLQIGEHHVHSAQPIVVHVGEHQLKAQGGLAANSQTQSLELKPPIRGMFQTTAPSSKSS